MNGLRPDEMKLIKEMEEGEWRLLVWSELKDARHYRKIMMLVLGTFLIPLAGLVAAKFGAWMLSGVLMAVPS